MKAMVFAAGIGTRLRPLTDSMPKALVEVAGVPVLEHVILSLKSARVCEAVVNVHHFPEQIRAFLESRSCFGMDIHISDESECLLDTGGGILAARSWLDGGEPFIVHNADIMTDMPIGDIVAAHRHSGADVTLLSQHRPTSRHFMFDSTLRLRGWSRADGSASIPAGLDVAGLSPLAFGGVSVVSPAVFPLLERHASAVGRVFSTTPFYAENCEALDIRAFVPAIAHRWFDIGKPDTLAAARAAF